MSAFATPASWFARPSIVRHASRRLPNEFYPTPPEATRALLSVEDFDGPIWEPACGDGRMAKVLSDHGQCVVSTDLHAYGHGESGIDFLKERKPRAKHIVTNPPYGRGLADRFVNHALTLTRQTGGKVAMLLDMSSLNHTVRTAWWRSNPPARLYAIDGIDCWPDHVPRPPQRFFVNRYVWAVWTQEHQGPSAFWWLSGADFRARKTT